MLANRVSYSLGLTGPSFTLDTACSSLMYALHAAARSIEAGECDAAIVGACNLMLLPQASQQFFSLGVLATDGVSRPFDHKAGGYTRSETICAFYLQRAGRAKRTYASVLNTRTNCDGHKLDGNA